MHKFSLKRIEFSIVLSALFLSVFGLSTFYSIDISLFRQQLISLFIAIAAYFIFLNIDYRIFGYFSKYIYIAILVALFLLLFIGLEARGSVRWLEIFGLRIQFTEIIKPFFIIFIAQFLSQDSSRKLSKFIKLLILIAPILILTLIQPDLGTAIIFTITAVFMLFMFGFPFRFFLGGALITIISIPLLFTFLYDYQKERLLTFIDLTRDPLGSSYNAIQSLISIGSGGLFGKGFGESTQSLLLFLPERHTDFIFATITESLGLVGAGVLITIYLFMMYKVYRIAQVTSDEFSVLIVFGFYFLFLTQIFLNIGMNIGIVPIVGITLPFVSYGGNSIISSFIILGIISSIKFDFIKNKRHMEIV